MPTYTEYQAAGGTLSETDYNRLARRAWAYLDTLTLGKAAAVTGPVRDKVCLCVFDLADTMYHEEQGGDVISATNDGYSETYARSGKSAEEKLYASAALYLATTGLLDRRMSSCACLHGNGDLCPL